MYGPTQAVRQPKRQPEQFEFAQLFQVAGVLENFRRDAVTEQLGVTEQLAFGTVGQNHVAQPCQNAELFFDHRRRKSTREQRQETAQSNFARPSVASSSTNPHNTRGRGGAPFLSRMPITISNSLPKEDL